MFTITQKLSEFWQLFFTFLGHYPTQAMKPSQFLTLLFLTFSFQVSAQNLKALVGGTLIDGFGGTPIRNSVIIVEGEGIMVVVEVKKLS
jgi:hypothetical protein